MDQIPVRRPFGIRLWIILLVLMGLGAVVGGGAATLDQFDMLGAIVTWVEKDTAPDSVVAIGRAFPSRGRPLCPYPQYAHYKGKGDPEAAENYGCCK